MILETLESSKILNRLEKLRSQVGITPLVPLKDIYSNPGVKIFAKQEWKQLSGSVKCRAAFFIIRDAVEKGLLNDDIILLDATSGNTGIAYASICQQVGLKLTLCIPENASRERKEILRSLGAEIIYTSRLEGTDGAQDVAQEMVKLNPGKYFYADQYKNENNWRAHYTTTGPEIFLQERGITHFVCGLGTTGTFVGTTRKLKELNPMIKSIGLQPDSPLHALEGWKHLETAKVPGIYDSSLADEIIEVSTEESYQYIKLLKEKEGLRVSPSSAANVAGAVKLAEKIGKGLIVTVLPDNGDKYSDVLNTIF